VFNGFWNFIQANPCKDQEGAHEMAAGASLKNGSMMKNGMQKSKGFEI